MKNRTIRFNKYKLRLPVCLWCFILCVGICGATVRADVRDSDFNIDPYMISSPDHDTYDIQVTVSNAGEDFNGSVRILTQNTYRNSSAYDTVISLPSGSTKQFVVRIPSVSLDNLRGNLTIQLVDKKGRVKITREFPGFLTNELNFLSLGVLSDNYPSLTFMDLGGNTLYYFNDKYPIKLSQVVGDDLALSLESLTMLVIDQYDTSSLSAGTITAIENWVQNGGVLFLGTGGYGDKPLSGFNPDKLGVSVVSILDPEDNLNYFSDISVDVRQLTMTLLSASDSNFNTGYYAGGYVGSVGDGAVIVLPYSLGELGTLDASAFDDYDLGFFTEILMDNTCGFASRRYDNRNHFESLSYNMQRFFGVLGNSLNPLHFGLLLVLIILYVLFVGPILYLILRASKKQEFYWLIVPASALFMVFLVYLTGRGFEVKSTRIYSVSVADASGKGKQSLFLQCYDAGHEEWQVKMADPLEYIGPIFNEDYSDDERYLHRIVKEGGSFLAGANPASTFKNVYFKGVKANPENGGLTVADIYRVNDDCYSGTVTNNTGKDFLYFAVVTDANLLLYSDLPAGATCDLLNKKPVDFGSMPSYYRGDPNTILLYNYIRPTYEEQSKENVSALSALGVGLCSVYQDGTDMVIGVTENYTKSTDDPSCREISYGCLYTILNANNTSTYNYNYDYELYD